MTVLGLHFELAQVLSFVVFFVATRVVIREWGKRRAERSVRESDAARRRRLGPNGGDSLALRRAPDMRVASGHGMDVEYALFRHTEHREVLAARARRALEARWAAEEAAQRAKAQADWDALTPEEREERRQAREARERLAWQRKANAVAAAHYAGSGYSMATGVPYGIEREYPNARCHFCMGRLTYPGKSTCQRCHSIQP